MPWVFPTFFAASVLETLALPARAIVLEEYAFPGGFVDLMKQLVTTPMAIVVNGLTPLVHSHYPSE